MKGFVDLGSGVIVAVDTIASIHKGDPRSSDENGHAVIVTKDGRRLVSDDWYRNIVERLQEATR